MSTLNHSYTFKSLAGNNQESGMRAHALCDGTIKEVTPHDWTDGFKSELTKHQGSLIVISEDDTSDDLKTALTTYAHWCTNGTKEFQSLENGMEFVYMENNLNNKAERNIDNDNDKEIENDDTHKTEHNNNNNTQHIAMKIARVKTIIKGNLLVITGSFPDITITPPTTFDVQNAATGSQKLDDNKTQFSGTLRWAISIFVSLLLSIGITAVYYSNQKENYTKRDLLIATSIIGACGIISVRLVFKFIGRWSMKRKISNVAEDA
ncbi:hypothetical protein C6P45_001735 [Maudiozyma exigua]|uniref:Uncharacterized protein n=1 Tax=Maudiozyma exigua TaxID=34358 RepID=A0A9P7B514_MAUEX|nr:hypothetical protein C6P45_001735 [Kazachstania exigua]